MKREEAIKVAIGMHGWLETDREREALETLIPELREGDSDRIRKEIIFALKWANHRGVYDKHIAYLEQQEEQKSLNISAASEWLRKHICNYMNSEYNEFHQCVEYDGSIDKERLINDFEEAMQEEQEPINEGNMHEPTLDEAMKWNEAYEKGYSLGYKNGRNDLSVINGRHEQKACEWSEKDENALREVKLNFELNHEDMTPDLVDCYERFFKKVKSLSPVKQEWSEEDEKILDYIIKYLTNYDFNSDECYRDMSYSTFCKLRVNAINFLKSLRPQPKQETE